VGKRVAVVGAGYAGMAAAVTLAERGISVTVFEAGPVLGGRARRITSHGTVLDNGQHIFVGAYRELLRLMREVGVPSTALLRMPLEIRYANGFAVRALGLPAPWGVLAGLLLARGVPLSDRAGAVRFMGAVRKTRFRLREDMPFAQLLAKYGQNGRIGDHLWRALCVSALNTPVEQASANVFLAVLRDTLAGGAEASELILPRVDLSSLFPEPAARYVASRGGEIRLGETVLEVEELRSRFSAVIVAVGPHQLKSVLPDLAREYNYQPIYTCYLQYGESTSLSFPMLGIDRGLVQWVFDLGALRGEKGRLACVISAEGAHQRMTLDELAQACHRELAQVLPTLERPRWMRVIAEKRATVACTPGRELPREDMLPAGISLAGDYTDPEYPPTIEAAVRSGVRAALKITQ
jgi:hydroxysqualene dehydroxylase